MGAPTTTFTESGTLLERAPALAVLEEAFTTVRETSGGRLVFVCGEIGAGKTVLVRRFSEATVDRARIVWGACDPLFAPRPLGPLLDIARVTGGDFADLVQAGALPHDVASALIGELSDRPPAVLVLEDVHWADGATLDVLRLLGRRVDEAQALVIATYRDTELGPFHPLRQVLGEVGAGRTSVRIRLDPLSPSAVAELAEPYDADPVALYAMTGGNPFFVTEALAAGEDEIPPTVRDAVLARAARLSAPGRALLEAVAVVPSRAELSLLEAVTPETLSSLDECLASGMLVSGSEAVSFRHELARLAIEEAIPPDRTLALHRAVLAALVESPDAVDLARLAHHAEGATNSEAVLRFAIGAAERAASLGAHTEAAAQYGRALRFADALPLEERAALLRRRSFECFLVAQDAEALVATDAAIACYRELDQPTQVGECLRSRALILLNLARVAEGIESAEKAIEVLGKLPPGHELAMSYGTRAALTPPLRGRDGGRTLGAEGSRACRAARRRRGGGQRTLQPGSNRSHAWFARGHSGARTDIGASGGARAPVSDRPHVRLPWRRRVPCSVASADGGRRGGGTSVLRGERCLGPRTLPHCDAGLDRARARGVGRGDRDRTTHALGAMSDVVHPSPDRARAAARPPRRSGPVDAAGRGGGGCDEDRAAVVALAGRGCESGGSVARGQARVDRRRD